MIEGCRVKNNVRENFSMLLRPMDFQNLLLLPWGWALLITGRFSTAGAFCPHPTLVRDATLKPRTR